jgi:hypothetical protein
MLKDRRNSVVHVELGEINAKTIKSWHMNEALSSAIRVVMWH